MTVIPGLQTQIVLYRGQKSVVGLTKFVLVQILFGSIGETSGGLGSKFSLFNTPALFVIFVITSSNSVPISFISVTLYISMLH